MSEAPERTHLSGSRAGLRGLLRAGRLTVAYYVRVLSRGWSDAWRFGHRQGLILGAVVAVITAVGDKVGEPQVHLLHIVLAGLAAFAAVMLVLIVGNIVVAPVRLFEEARAGLLEDLGTDPRALAKVFSDWVRTRQAALPQGGFRQSVGLFPWDGESADTHAQRRLDDERRKDGIERVHAQARTEYHERFRTFVTNVLGDTPQTREPQTIGDLETLSVRLARATGARPAPKVVLRALGHEGRKLHDGIPMEPTVEQREAFERRVDSFRDRVVEELSECAPEFVGEIDNISPYHPAALAEVPLEGSRLTLKRYVAELLAVVARATKEV